MPHLHHGVACRLPPELPWCDTIESVLRQIAEVAPAQHEFVTGRLIEFGPLPDEIVQEIFRKAKAGNREIYAPNATFMLPPVSGSEVVPQRGSIELMWLPPLVPADPERRRCILAHELAHAFDVLGCIARTGAIPGRSMRADEEEADRILAAWGFRCSDREEMAPGGWYDRQKPVGSD